MTEDTETHQDTDFVYRGVYFFLILLVNFFPPPKKTIRKICNPKDQFGMASDIVS